MSMATEFTPETVKGWLALSPFIAFMRLEFVSVDAQKSEIVMKMPMRPEFERGWAHRGAVSRWSGFIKPLASHPEILIRILVRNYITKEVTRYGDNH
jgi:hypothetical protein